MRIMKRPSPDPDPGPMPPDPSPFPPPQPPLPDPQPTPSPPTRPPIPQLVRLISCLVLTVGLGGFSGVLWAQVAPGSLSAPSPPGPTSASISPIQPLSAPTSGIPATVVTPATTNRLASPTLPSSAPTFTGAGRGLPGMPGGPPLTGSLGARDPSSQYMTPRSIGPLFCDPAINIAC
jgi:hypothetical protein